MKKLIACLIALMMCASFVLFTGCNGNDPEPEPELTPTPTPTAEPTPEPPAPTPDPQDDEDDEDDEEEYNDEDDDDEIAFTYDLDLIYENLDETYFGLLETGEIIGIGNNEDGSFAFIFIADEHTHITYVGSATIVGESFTVVDMVTGAAITIELIHADESSLIIEVEDRGDGVLGAVETSEFMDLLTIILTETVAVG